MAKRNMWPVVVAAGALVLFLLGYVVGTAGQSAALDAPGSSSPEAGFSRSMQLHHNQGVELALMARDRSEDETFRVIAYDMAVTQAQQSGQMYGWLAAWGVPQYSPDDPMAWMEVVSPEHDHFAGDPNAPMPGMATREEIAVLEEAAGVEAEVIFLQMMIEHHKGALDMSEAVLALSDHPTVTMLAQAILDSQAIEITLMEAMLAERT
ncbi:MAG: DUF305 domain-containing protein [Demequina sp.]